jgi:hypothetical protein
MILLERMKPAKCIWVSVMPGRESADPFSSNGRMKNGSCSEIEMKHPKHLTQSKSSGEPTMSTDDVACCVRRGYSTYHLLSK